MTAESLDVRECLDVRYTGVTNWVYYAGAQLTEGSGNLNENGGLTSVDGIGPAACVWNSSDETRWFQKYFVGARWYPAPSHHHRLWRILQKQPIQLQLSR